MIWILNGLEARLTPFLLRMEGPTDRASGHTLVPANMRHLIAIASWKGVTKKVASMRCAYTWYRVYNILANTCVFNPRLELHIPYRIRLRAFKSALSMHSLSRITYLTLELSLCIHSVYAFSQFMHSLSCIHSVYAFTQLHSLSLCIHSVAFIQFMHSFSRITYLSLCAFTQSHSPKQTNEWSQLIVALDSPQVGVRWKFFKKMKSKNSGHHPPRALTELRLVIAYMSRNC